MTIQEPYLGKEWIIVSESPVCYVCQSVQKEHMGTLDWPAKCCLIQEFPGSFLVAQVSSMTFFTETVCVILESMCEKHLMQRLAWETMHLLCFIQRFFQRYCHDIYSSLEYSFMNKIGSYNGPSRKPVVTLKLVCALTSAETFPTSSL